MGWMIEHARPGQVVSWGELDASYSPPDDAYEFDFGSTYRNGLAMRVVYSDFEGESVFGDAHIVRVYRMIRGHFRLKD